MYFVCASSWSEPSKMRNIVFSVVSANVDKCQMPISLLFFLDHIHDSYFITYEILWCRVLADVSLPLSLALLRCSFVSFLSHGSTDCQVMVVIAFQAVNKPLHSLIINFVIIRCTYDLKWIQTHTQHIPRFKCKRNWLQPHSHPIFNYFNLLFRFEISLRPQHLHTTQVPAIRQQRQPQKIIASHRIWNFIEEKLHSVCVCVPVRTTHTESRLINCILRNINSMQLPRSTHKTNNGYVLHMCVVLFLDRYSIQYTCVCCESVRPDRTIETHHKQFELEKFTHSDFRGTIESIVSMIW